MAGEGVLPGMVAALHSASSDLRWHPHVHALTWRGGWDRTGAWHAVPYVDERTAELLFRQKEISRLAAEGLLGAERLELLDSWKSGHTGFSAHNRVTVSAGDGAGLERLELGGVVVRYRHKRARRAGGEAFDAHDSLARLLKHAPLEMCLEMCLAPARQPDSSSMFRWKCAWQCARHLRCQSPCFQRRARTPPGRGR